MINPSPYDLVYKTGLSFEELGNLLVDIYSDREDLQRMIGGVRVDPMHFVLDKKNNIMVIYHESNDTYTIITSRSSAVLFNYITGGSFNME